MPSPSATPTPITPPRVPLTDERTGLIDRSWYMFFLSLFRASQSADDATLGPSAESLIASYDEALRTLAQASETAPLSPQLEQQLDSLRQELQVLPRAELGTFAALQQANLPWTTFDTTPQSVPELVTGTLYWDDQDRSKTLALVMEDTGDIIQDIGEETFYRVKATATITKGQVLMFTGTVGSSGGILAAPATGLTPTQSEYILGVATQNIATNAWGYATWFGEIKGINTTGGAEAWVDGQILYYNPAVAGGLTKNVPTAPNPKVIVAAVVHAASNGILFVRPTFGSALGATDSNVEISGLTNGDLLQYDGVQMRWENVPASTLPVGTATNIAGGAAGSVPYQTAPSTTTFLPIGTAAQVLKVNSGATAPEWVSGAALTKTDDTNVTLTLGGTPATSLLAATSLTLGWTGQLAVSRGGTGVSTATANYVFAGPTSGGAAAPSFRALVAGDIPALPYNPTAAPVTQTANFSVGATDVWIINNKSGSSCTVTLPAAASYSGRVLYFQNYQAQTLVSASSNVVPVGGGAAGTSILLASAGDQCTLVSDGTNWIMMQYTPNNILLLE